MSVLQRCILRDSLASFKILQNVDIVYISGTVYDVRDLVYIADWKTVGDMMCGIKGWGTAQANQP